MQTNPNINLTMLCDFYELTMANGYFRSGMQDKITYFDLFFRRVPDEGGFAIARGSKGETIEEAGRAAVIAPWGVSAVVNVSGYEAGVVVMPEPNTNLMAPRTLLPTLTAKLAPGTHLLTSAVLGTVTGGAALLNNHPTEVTVHG